MPKTKSKQDMDDLDEFITPWYLCPSCHQKYQNELAIDIANKFVSFVRRQYLDDTQRQAEALYVKLRALNNMLDRLQPVQKREAGVTADVLISLIDQMKNYAPLSKHYLWFEAIAHGAHGYIALEEGTEESARRAVTHFEEYLEVFEAIGDAEGIAHAKASIAIAKSMYEGGSNEEVLEASQELYELRVAELGEKNELTIDSGKVYAMKLQDADRRDEARELSVKLLATSKQVLGPHHKTTKDVEFALQEVEFALQEDDDDDDDSDDIEAREPVTDPLYESILFVSLLIGMLGMLYDISLQKTECHSGSLEQ